MDVYNIPNRNGYNEVKVKMSLTSFRVVHYFTRHAKLTYSKYNIFSN